MIFITIKVLLAVYTPKVIRRTAPARRIFLDVRKALNHWLPYPMVNIEGSVPSPKNSIVSAPWAALPVTLAHVSIE